MNNRKTPVDPSNHVHYELAEKKCIIPDAQKALQSGYVVTPEGVLYKVIGVKHLVRPMCLILEVEKDFRSDVTTGSLNVAQVVQKYNAVLAQNI